MAASFAKSGFQAVEIDLNNKDKPGCAFTRSIGDATGERVGVISDPELTKKEIKEHDKVSCEGGAQLIAYTRVCTVS